MPLITWNDATLGVQNEVIDSQHKQLIEMINLLNEAMTSRQGFRITDEVLVKTLDYAYYHFRTEEELMEKSAYPRFARHKDQHEAFRVKITDLRQRSKDHDATIPRELLEYLRNWLIHHITVTDKELGLFLLEKGQ